MTSHGDQPPSDGGNCGASAAPAPAREVEGLRRLELAESELQRLGEELARTRKARDVLIHQSLGTAAGLGAGSARAAPRHGGSAGRLALLVLCVGLLGVVAMLTLRLQLATRTLRQGQGGGGRQSGASRSARSAGVAWRQPSPLRPSRVEVIPVPRLRWLYRAALSPDAARVAVAGADGEAALFNLASDEITAELRGHRGLVRDVVFVADGRLVSGGEDGSVRLWSADGRLQRLLRAGGPAVRSLAAAAGIVAVASDASGVEIYPTDVAMTKGAAAAVTGVPRRLAGESEGWVRCVALTADGKLLASGGEDGLVRLWRADTGERLAELAGHKLWLNALAFSPDGRWLASAGFDGRIRLWDVARREQLGQLGGHVLRVQALAFSPSGKLLASAGLDRRVVIWDVVRREQRFLLAGHQRQVTSVSFDPRGRFVLSAGGDGTLRIWPVPPPVAPTSIPWPPPAPGELTLRGNTSGERVRVRVVDESGEVFEGGRAALAHALRSGPDDQSLPPDPELVKLLYRVASRFGRQREILVISGFRSPRFNRLRTRQSRQVGERSLHIQGKAIDFRIDGVAITTLHKFVKGLRAGGVGYYPDSNFVHMDTGPVRYWSGN